MDDTLELILSIYPRTIAVDELNRRLSVDTAFVGRRGDVLSEGVERKRDVWQLAASMRRGCPDLDECWSQLETQISEQREELQEVAKVEEVKLDLVVCATTKFPEMKLSSSTLRSIASYDLTLEIHVYADLAEADYEWQERLVRNPRQSRR